MPKCSTCMRPDIDRINAELALSSSSAAVARRYGINRRSMSRHRSHCMTQQQIAHLRGMSTSQAEVDIDELVRKGGQEAILGLSRLLLECKTQAEKCDQLNLYRDAATYRKLQLLCYQEKAKIAALYPGRKTVNNTLVIGDAGALFDLLDKALKPFPDARYVVAEVFAQQSKLPALEHEHE